METEDIKKIADRNAADRDERQRRKDKNRIEKNKTRSLRDMKSLKELKKALNPTYYIPYDIILREDGHLGYHMSLKIKQRKKEIMDEMSKIMKVESRYPEMFKKDTEE